MINTDLDSDYSYYTPNGAVVTAANIKVYNMLLFFAVTTAPFGVK